MTKARPNPVFLVMAGLGVLVFVAIAIHGLSDTRQRPSHPATARTDPVEPSPKDIGAFAGIPLHPRITSMKCTPMKDKKVIYDYSCMVEFGDGVKPTECTTGMSDDLDGKFPSEAVTPGYHILHCDLWAEGVTYRRAYFVTDERMPEVHGALLGIENAVMGGPRTFGDAEERFRSIYGSARQIPEFARALGVLYPTGAAYVRFCDRGLCHNGAAWLATPPNGLARMLLLDITTAERVHSILMAEKQAEQEQDRARALKGIQ